MPLKTIYIDVDDTLYSPSTGIWDLIGDRMDLYIHDRLNLDWAIIPQLRRKLFETYGTTMRGLQLTYAIDTEDFLSFVHDVPVEDKLEPDPVLKTVLSALPYRKIILTNADQNHARRVLRCLAVEDCFEDIVDIHKIAPACKPQPEAYLKALSITGENDPACCAFVDDSPRNLQTAHELGFLTILVGSELAHPSANFSIPRLVDLPTVLSRVNGSQNLAQQGEWKKPLE